MPNEIDDLIADVTAGKRTEKGPYQPAKGEEAIFAAPEKESIFDFTAPAIPLLAAVPKGLLGAIAPMIPGYRQLTGETPWLDPQGSAVPAFMDIASVISGFATPGRGMAKAAIPKGASAISKALEEIGANLFRKGGVPAVIEKGPLPALGGGRFQRKGAEDVVEAKTRKVPQQGQIAGAIERKQLPRAGGYPEQRSSYAGPTAPRGIPQPYAPQSWRERTFPGTLQRAQDVIEDLFRESLRAKGMID